MLGQGLLHAGLISNTGPISLSSSNTIPSQGLLHGQAAVVLGERGLEVRRPRVVAAPQLGRQLLEVIRVHVSHLYGS